MLKQPAGACSACFPDPTPHVCLVPNMQHMSEDWVIVSAKQTQASGSFVCVYNNCLPLLPVSASFVLLLL